MSLKTSPSSVPAVAPAMEQQPLASRRHETWSPGDCAFQGDLIFVCLPALPKTRKARKNRQLAEGETRGSRHVLEGGQLFDGDASELSRLVANCTNGRISTEARYIGPVFTGPATVTHPQHQHQAFPAETVTACVYQRNLDAEGREQRARD